MSGTTATIAGLYGQMPDNTSGLILPVNDRNIIATLAARTGGLLGGGSFVRVTDPEFGADPTGVADSTAAFQNAMAAGPAIVPAMQPNGSSIAVYKVANCVVPNGGTLFSETPRGYPGASLLSDINMKPEILVPSGATWAFNIDSKHGISFRGLRIVGPGYNTTTDGISPGSTSLYIKDCLIMGFRNGVGGPAVGGSTATYPTYQWEMHMNNSMITQCTTGIVNLVDSWIEGSSLAANINGWNGISSKNMLTHSRIEWNGLPFTGGVGSGLNINCNDLTVSNCQFDANGNAGVTLTGNDASFTGCLWTENGCNVTAGTTLIAASAHMAFAGMVRCSVTGCISTVDSQAGPWAPCAFANFSGTNNGILFVGNNLSGYQGSTAGASKLGPVSSNTTWRTGTPPSGTGGLNGMILMHNFGTGTAAQDVDTR